MCCIFVMPYTNNMRMYCHPIIISHQAFPIITSCIHYMSKYLRIVCVYIVASLLYMNVHLYIHVDGMSCFSSGRVSPKKTVGLAILTLKYPRT